MRIDRVKSPTQKIVVTAKCPKCKKKKQFTNQEPLNFTPHCHTCFVPLFIDKIDITKL